MPKSRFVTLWAVSQLALMAAAPARAADVMPLDTAAHLFGPRPDAANADLSPDGTRLVYLAAGKGGVTQARLRDIATLTDKGLVSSGGKPEQLQSCSFATNRWVVCTIVGNAHYLDVVIGVSRTVAIDTVTGTVRKLGVNDQFEQSELNQFDGRVIDWLPDEDGALMMQRNHARGVNNVSGLSADWIQIDPFKVRQVEPPRVDATAYATDGHGKVRFMAQSLSDLDDMLTGKSRFLYRTAGSNDWHDLGPQDDAFQPLLVERSTDSLYYLDKLDGRAALYRRKLDATGAVTLVARNPDVDIDGTIQIASGDPVIGYRYTDQQSRSVYTDPVFAKLGAALSKALPETPLINLTATSKDKKKLLIYASSDRDPGAYFLLDRGTMQMKAVLASRLDLDPAQLAPVRPVSITTRDGKVIPGYVTIRRDGPQTGLPTVVLPHGGPSSRDEWGFDWLAQFLAARGYAVIQPEYRGSAGYGEAFLGDTAFKGWRLAMSDIANSADWLVKQGIADPKRMAIVGWSYGGYAALQSASMDPRYKAVVAIAPVTDLGALRRDAEGFTDADIAKERIGKGAFLKEGSPMAHADQIKAPVLLVHGDLDNNVRIAHSQRMNAALQRAGTSVEFLSYKTMTHQLDDSDVRIEVLTHIGALLERTIGH